MNKVIKIVVSDEFLEEHICATPETLTGKGLSFDEGMARLLLTDVIEGKDEVEVTSDRLDEVESKLLKHAILNCLTIKMKDNGKKNA